MDSRATHHITPKITNLQNLNPFMGLNKVVVRNGKELILNIGLTSLQSNSCSFCLRNVLHDLLISTNLISVQKLYANNKVFLEFHSSFFMVKDLSLKKVLLQGPTDRDLYKVPQKSL